MGRAAMTSAWVFEVALAIMCAGCAEDALTPRRVCLTHHDCPEQRDDPPDQPDWGDDTADYPSCEEVGPPVEGGPCDERGNGYECFVEVPLGCGTFGFMLACEEQPDGSLMWVDVSMGEPPACPPADCHALSDEAACSLDASCRWRVPGCFDQGGETPIVEGCYPAGDCDAVSCDRWGQCLTVVHHPCIDGSCELCGEEISVCAPP